MLTHRLLTRSFAIATAAAIAASATFGAASVNAANSNYKQAIEDQVVPKVRAFIADRTVTDAINAQNARFAGLSQSNIEQMDKQWRAETATGGGKLINALLNNDLSHYLAGIQQNGQGLYTEIFVMDNKGLNVGQSGLTSDYWQGDEAKWQDTYGKGAGSMLIDEVEFDESTQTFQSQLSLPVTDPVSGEVIGAITVGVNVDLLQ